MTSRAGGSVGGQEVERGSTILSEADFESPGENGENDSPQSADGGVAFGDFPTMEQKSSVTRGAVKAVARMASAARRCAHGGGLTTPPERDAIRVAPGATPAKGRVEVVETYFDAAGRPAKRKGLGAARVARAYDAKGNQVEEAYFNAEGKPTVREDLGAARIAWRYDESGRRVEAALYGADGTRIRRRSGGAANKRGLDGS